MPGLVVGVMELTMAVPAGTLKEKRSIVRRTSRTRQRFPVSAAEVAEQDVVTTMVIGITYVDAEARRVEGYSKVEQFIETLMLAEPFDRFMRLEYY